MGKVCISITPEDAIRISMSIDELVRARTTIALVDVSIETGTHMDGIAAQLNLDVMSVSDAQLDFLKSFGIRVDAVGDAYILVTVPAAWYFQPPPRTAKEALEQIKAGVLPFNPLTASITLNAMVNRNVADCQDEIDGLYTLLDEIEAAALEYMRIAGSGWHLRQHPPAHSEWTDAYMKLHGALGKIQKADQ